MTEVIQSADIEQALCDWLSTKLAAYGRSVHVGTLIPNPRPGEFVRVLLVGGQRQRGSRVIDTQTVALEAWAAAEGAACSLALLLEALSLSMPDQDVTGLTVYRVDEFAGPANLPDPESTQSRYTMTLSFTTRASAVEEES